MTGLSVLSLVALATGISAMPAANLSLNRGSHTLHVPLHLFAKNRERLCTAIKEKIHRTLCCGVNPGAKTVVVVQGGSDKKRYHTDANDLAFRQESFFSWAFGVLEPDFYGAIDVDSGESVLFMPKLSSEYIVWMGVIHGPEHFKAKYEVDRVLYVDEINETLQKMEPSQLLLLKGRNTDSGNWLEPADFDGMDSFKKNTGLLYPIMTELRVFKTEEEQEVLRYAAKISADGHKAAIKGAKPGMYEYQLESIFRHTCLYEGGARYLGYTCISASGSNAAVLHYGHAGEPNSRQFLDGDLCLMDMGAEYFCYGADITTTFPCNGTFTERQKIVYNAVLDANQAVMNTAKPGVPWADMHRLAEQKILEHLKKAGVLKGDVQEMVSKRLGAVFMPHGLGHFLGMDVHDVGGYPEGVERIQEPGLKNLRTTRTLQKGMYITIEPGCYFIDPVLDKALGNPELAQFLVPEVLDRFRGMGGVRIEDDVLITEEGTDNFSDALPRTVEDIEAFMAQ